MLNADRQHAPAVSLNLHASRLRSATTALSGAPSLSCSSVFRLPTVNLNLKSFQAKWNNENIPPSASEPLYIMYSQERKNTALCQDRRDSGGDNASFSSPYSSSGIGFPLKTDMFDSCGVARVFTVSALLKMENGKRGEGCGASAAATILACLQMKQRYPFHIQFHLESQRSPL